MKTFAIHALPQELQNLIRQAEKVMPAAALPSGYYSFLEYGIDKLKRLGIDANSKHEVVYAIAKYDEVGGDLIINENPRALNAWANPNIRRSYVRKQGEPTDKRFILYHELGHFFDKNKGWLSDSDTWKYFMDNYDVGTLADYGNYALGRNWGGYRITAQRESFADSFAHYLCEKGKYMAYPVRVFFKKLIGYPLDYNQEEERLRLKAKAMAMELDLLELEF